jgi:hypothetical protein
VAVKPQAIQDALIVKEVVDETLVYDRRRHQAHCLNRTAALVWSYCDGRTSAAEMASRLGAELAAPVDEAVVWLALERLRKAHLLQDGDGSPAAGGRRPRRDLLQRLGAAGLAIGLPTVMTIAAPTAAEAATAISDAACAARHPPCGNVPCSQNAGNSCRQVSATACSCSQN